LTAYLIAEFRCAARRAKLAADDFVAIGLALNGGLITPYQAVMHIEETDAFRFLGRLPGDNWGPEWAESARRYHEDRERSAPKQPMVPGPRRTARRHGHTTMNTQNTRTRLANRRLAETFVLECGGLRYTCTVGRFPDGRLAEVFLSNHKSNSAADANARDAAIVCSIALQCGADIGTIRRALSRDSRGHTTGPLGVALDLICGEGER